MRKKAIENELRAQIFELMLDNKALGLERTAIGDIVRELAERTHFTPDDTKLAITGYTDVVDYLSMNRTDAPHRYGAGGNGNNGNATPSNGGMTCGLPTEEFNKLPAERRLELHAEANRPVGF